MNSKELKLFGNAIALINNIYLDEDITPDTKVLILRSLGYKAEILIEGVNKSQSRTHVGAERDTCPSCHGWGATRSGAIGTNRCNRCKGTGKI